MGLYAEVIIPLAVPGTFTYSVPDHFVDILRPGCRVVVSFGRRRLYTSIVRSVSKTAPEGIVMKPIEGLLDNEPVVSTETLRFWDWISTYYMCYPGEVIKAALPSLLLPASESVVTANHEGVKEGILSGPARSIFDLVSHAGVISLGKLPQQPGSIPLFKIIDELVNGGFISLDERLREKRSVRQELFVSLAGEPDEAGLIALSEGLSRAPAQLKVLHTYLEVSGYSGVGVPPVMSRRELAIASGASYHVIRSMASKGLLIEELGDKMSEEEDNPTELSTFSLSIAQTVARDEIVALLNQKKCVLLHGVTSSGKTEIYADIAATVLSKGEQVLFLLPEIGITSQVIKRMTRYFGNKADVYHSRLGEADRVKLWNSVSDDSGTNSTNIIIGVRSSLFLPFRRLGLIIVDEEHDGSYKQQDPAPRYNARDAAIMLGSITGAKVILGSATPSFESYHNATTGKFGLVELSERFGGATLPATILADERRARKRKSMVSHFTPELISEMGKVLESGSQTIIFRNRRGFATTVECNDCGHVISCPVCDVRLVYHKRVNRAVCHYCGHSTELPGECPECRSSNFAVKGFGTEKLEDELAIIFPDSTIDRIDQDTTRKKDELDRRLQQFSEGTTDILVGTQMITKGLDFPGLSLVGVLNADQMLNFPDFRAYEKSFQVLEQVSGRAGRREKEGIVVIQTSDPGSIVLKHVTSHDYKGLFHSLIDERKQFGYPPFTRLFRISVRHSEKHLVEEISGILARKLRKEMGQRVLGPEFPPVDRVKNQYVMNIMLKAEKRLNLEKFKFSVNMTLSEVQKEFASKRARISIDVDPW